MTGRLGLAYKVGRFSSSLISEDFIKSDKVADLTPDIISGVATAGGTRTSLLSVIAIHNFHGVGTQVVPNATAFSQRGKHFMIEIIAAWEPDSKQGAVHRQWASDIFSALAPLALPGGYSNFLEPDAPLDGARNSTFQQKIARRQLLPFVRWGVEDESKALNADPAKKRCYRNGKLASASCPAVAQWHGYPV